MSLNAIGSGNSVAMYWDFENLHAGVLEARYGEGIYAKPDNRFKPQEPLVDIQALAELAASFGPVAINRAYGNWQYFGRYRDALLQNAVELIQLSRQVHLQKTVQISSCALMPRRTLAGLITLIR
jgi:hypothetical protein